MTMRITIKNEDAQRVLKYDVEDFEMGSSTPKIVDCVSLEPGESREVWIHAARRVVVTESRHAMRPVPPSL